MEIHNLNCKDCPNASSIDRKCCDECLFSLYEVLSDKPKQDILTNKDGDFCMGCHYQYSQPSKCNGCVWKK